MPLPFAVRRFGTRVVRVEKSLKASSQSAGGGRRWQLLLRTHVYFTTSWGDANRSAVPQQQTPHACTTLAVTRLSAIQEDLSKLAATLLTNHMCDELQPGQDKLLAEPRDTGLWRLPRLFPFGATAPGYGRGCQRW